MSNLGTYPLSAVGIQSEGYFYGTEPLTSDACANYPLVSSENYSYLVWKAHTSGVKSFVIIGNEFSFTGPDTMKHY